MAKNELTRKIALRAIDTMEQHHEDAEVEKIGARKGEPFSSYFTKQGSFHLLDLSHKRPMNSSPRLTEFDTRPLLFLFVHLTDIQLCTLDDPDALVDIRCQVSDAANHNPKGIHRTRERISVATDVYTEHPFPAGVTTSMNNIGTNVQRVEQDNACQMTRKYKKVSQNGDCLGLRQQSEARSKEMGQAAHDIQVVPMQATSTSAA
ncbi:hypothetical protein CPB84DRAFT_1744341 [Gymnopilus junonius]|uniref:Uncharacterized protein n=1 Tax=Gymnopilus junonius TaxID=109634 RepID=A0A9P5NXY7_GYMJU|nr:hypothetical protein CPB84DRAFT_1744341 [Gymnopilus junonius]